MALPWFRADSHIGSHDKVLALLADPSPKRWQAFASYICALGWAVDHGTDGAVPKIALPFVHGTPATARLLVTYRMWSETLTGWKMVNFAERQSSCHHREEGQLRARARKATAAAGTERSAGPLRTGCHVCRLTIPTRICKDSFRIGSMYLLTNVLTDQEQLLPAFVTVPNARRGAAK